MPLLVLLGAAFVATLALAAAGARFVATASLRAGLRGIGAHLRDRRVLATCVVGAALLFQQVASLTFVSLRLQRPPFDLTTLQVGLVFVVFLVPTLVTPQVGRAVARFGRVPTFVAAATLGAAGLLLTLVPSVPAIVLGLACSCVAVFAGQACATGYLGAHARTNRSAAVGIYLTAYYLGGTIGGSHPRRSSRAPAGRRWCCSSSWWWSPEPSSERSRGADPTGTRPRGEPPRRRAPPRGRRARSARRARTRRASRVIGSVPQRSQVEVRVPHDVVEVLDRRVRGRVVLVDGAGAADEGERDPRSRARSRRSRCPRRRTRRSPRRSRRSVPDAARRPRTTATRTARGRRRSRRVPGSGAGRAACGGARRPERSAGRRGRRPAAGRRPGRRAAAAVAGARGGGGVRGRAGTRRDAVGVEEDEHVGPGGERELGAAVPRGGEREAERRGRHLLDHDRQRRSAGARAAATGSSIATTTYAVDAGRRLEAADLAVEVLVSAVHDGDHRGRSRTRSRTPRRARRAAGRRGRRHRRRSSAASPDRRASARARGAPPTRRRGTRPGPTTG